MHYSKYIYDVDMKYISIKICLVIVALFGVVNVVFAYELPNCPSKKGSWWNNCIGSETYANQSKYSGQFKDNKKDGQGTFIYPLGGKYVGEWKENEKSGQGTYTSSSGAKYVGEFKDDSYNGQGSYIYANGATYVGQFKEDERSGQGAYTYVDGKVEEGIWMDDKFQYAHTPSIEIETCSTNANNCNKAQLCGRASYFSGSQRLWDKAKSSQKYVTEAKKRGLTCGTTSTSAEPKSVSNLPNCPSNKKVRWHNCFGTITGSDGEKYVGEWKDSKRTGQGTFTYTNGDKYVGEWKDNKRMGQGTFTWPDGEKYVGEWKDSKRNLEG